MMQLPLLTASSAWQTKCIMCGSSMVAERSTKKTCSARCRKELQRKGCHSNEHSVTRTVHGTNDNLIKDAARLYIKPDDLVADVTFGKGTFWRKLPAHERRFTLISSDLATTAMVRADFRQLPYRDEALDVVVLDPPYVHRAHPRMMFNGRYNGASTTAGATFDDILRLYRDGMTEARRVLKPGGRLMVKTIDQVQNGKQNWAHIEIKDAAADLGMFARDLFVFIPSNPPSLYARPGRQIHARKSHSFLWVFERPRARAI